VFSAELGDSLEVGRAKKGHKTNKGRRMTKFYRDILQEPTELSKTLKFTLGEGKPAIDQAARILREATHIYIVGIGSSWNAGLSTMSFFNAAGRPAVLCEASELLHFGKIAKNAAVIFLSRSGKSVEIVRLLDKAAASGARIIAITNTPDSPLATNADVVLKMMAAFDHAVSVSMYSAMALVAAILACATEGTLDNSLEADLQRSLANTTAQIATWTEQISASDWLDPRGPVYLLGRGASLANCHEGQLLWEEAAKLPASAMPTGGFRHGPQEVIREGLRFALWIDRETMRAQDLAVAADLKKLGAKVLLIGQDLPQNAGDLVLHLPSIRGEWQFLIDIIPIQITAERLAHAGKQDCDTFRLCQYIVEDEGGLLPADMQV
jgi:glucosamine--fructose-6-phosphate aminotransferase (isomerizing)